MNALYADTSAVISAYLADEVDHRALRTLLFESDHLVLTSELTRVEFTGAVAATERQGRLRDATGLLARFDDDTTTGLLNLIPLEPARLMPAVRRLVMDSQPLRTIDAIHLAVALHDAPALTGGGPVPFVTRDRRQAEAAQAHGLEVC